MKDCDIQFKKIARILEYTASNAFEMHTDELIIAFEQAERECLSLVSTNEFKLEVNRRVAEWKLKLLCDKNESFESVDTIHKHILDLGYSNLENEGDIELYFAQHCVDHNQPDIARFVLQQLCSKLDEAIKTNNLAVFHYLKENSEQILSKIGPASE